MKRKPMTHKDNGSRISIKWDDLEWVISVRCGLLGVSTKQVRKRWCDVRCKNCLRTRK